MEHIMVKMNSVVWKNIKLPSPKQTHKSPVFDFDGSSWYFDVYCYWRERYSGTYRATWEEVWQFNIRYAKDIKYLDTYIIIPYAKIGGNYVRLASTITQTDIWKSSLSNIIPFGKKELTMLFFFLPDSFNIVPLDLADTAVQTFENDSDEKSLCLEGLSGDISQLFNSDGYADATLVCDNKSFSVHRNILATRSSVFSTMFESNTSESNNPKIEIVDLEPNILEQLLLFLYSGKVQQMCVNTAIELFKTAEKYAVQSLKPLCVSYILENMSKDVVCKIITLADEAGDEKLFDGVAFFTAENAEFFKSTEWENFALKYPNMAVKVYLKYFSRR